MSDEPTEEEQRHLDQFAASSRDFCALVERADGTDILLFLGDCQHLLARIYSQAFNLYDMSDNEDEDEPKVDYFAWQKKFEVYLGDYDRYLVVFDPYDSEPPINGSLSDDLADVYIDLWRGLYFYERGDKNAASSTWYWNMRTHTAQHILDALRAIHSIMVKS